MASPFSVRRFLIIFSVAWLVLMADHALLLYWYEFPLTVSIGLASGEPTRDWSELVFDRADQALYKAKATGRNRVVVDDTPHHG